MKLKPLALAIWALHLAQATISNLIYNYFPQHILNCSFWVFLTQIRCPLLGSHHPLSLVCFSQLKIPSSLSCHLCLPWWPALVILFLLSLSQTSETEALQYLLRCVRTLDALIHLAGPQQHEGMTPFWLIFREPYRIRPRTFPKNQTHWGLRNWWITY